MSQWINIPNRASHHQAIRASGWTGILIPWTLIGVSPILSSAVADFIPPNKVKTANVSQHLVSVITDFMFIEGPCSFELELALGLRPTTGMDSFLQFWSFSCCAILFKI
jgi:hypothetical protein